MFSAEQTGGANAQRWDHPRLRVSRNSQEVNMTEASQRGKSGRDDIEGSVFSAVSRAMAQQTLEKSLNLVVLPLKWLAGPGS